MIKPEKNMLCFIGGVMLLALSGGIFETTFNNFLSDTFDVGADLRGYLEFPRELPGFLVVILTGALFFLPETIIAALSCLAVGVGMLGLAYWGSSWNLMIALMILWSAGNHIMMPVRSSITLDLAKKGNTATLLGKMAAFGIAANVIGCGIVYISMKYMEVDYSLTFIIGGVAAIAASFFFLHMKLPGAHLKRPKFVFNAKYWLYYVLAFLFGARKQIFITFGPWVLVRVFDQPAWVIAQLWIVAALLGIFFQPLLGRWIDRHGERRVLMIDSLCVFVVCMGYGFADSLSNSSLALYLLYACFVGDQLLFGANMARTTFLSRIALKKEDVSPTLSLGITINHAVSMTIPALGGLLWIHYGHSWVFISAAGVAVVMLLFSAMIPARAPELS